MIGRILDMDERMNDVNIVSLLKPIYSLYACRNNNNLN